MKKQEQYYRIAHDASLNRTHPAVIAISGSAESVKRILDLGCGDGTRLGNLKTRAEKIGVDINDFAIKKASKNFPDVEFVKVNIEKLPFKSNSFDLVYSMFVIEHVVSPEKVIKEAVRVLKKGDSFILCAPNYGAPNRRSPNSKENKLSKLAKSLFRKSDGNFLGWTKVKPSKGEYFIDTDTRVEPFIGSLIPFLEKLKLKIIKKSSLWEIDDFSVKQLPFRFLGSLKIPPFDYWGPQIFVISKK